MKIISIVSAAIVLASSSVSAGNDPRECEGEKLGLMLHNGYISPMYLHILFAILFSTFSNSLVPQ